MPISLLVDPQDQELPGNPDTIVDDLTAATTVPEEAPQPTAAAPAVPADVPELPEKYRGKSVEEIVDMHRNLERLYGQTANDLGTQRQLTDQLLELKREKDLGQNSPEPAPTITAGDLLDNPQETLDKYVTAKTGQVTEQTLSRLQQLEAQLAQERFAKKHGDVTEIAQSDAFNSWLSKSPLRLQAAQVAAQGDWNVADALLNDYKEYQTLTQPSTSATQAQDPALNAAKNASLEGGHSSAGNAAKAPGKVYRRVDLIQLKLTQPDVYNDPGFQSEIVKAYQEGRVK